MYFCSILKTMRYYILLLLICFNFVVHAQEDYTANMSLDYLWGDTRWGANFNANFNILSPSHKRPLFIGGSLGMTQPIGVPNVSQSDLNAFGRDNMRGTTLTGARIEDGNSEIGFGGGFNIIKYIYTGFDGIPYVGAGLRYYYFPKEKVEIDIDSEDSQFYYTDTESMEIKEAFWKPGYEIHMVFGTSFEAYYGVYPMAGPNFQYIGLTLPLIY